MKQSRKDFIKQAHESACSDWKKNIENEFPKLFKKDDLVVGKWVKTNKGSIFCIEKIIGNTLYGFGIGYRKKIWDKNYFASKSVCLLAIGEEAKQTLIKEANKKDYKNVKINNLESIGNMLSFHHSISSSDCYYYNATENALWFMGKLIFWNGKWAEIVKETITKEQAEKELGKTILN
jgi:hypothetical protein